MKTVESHNAELTGRIAFVEMPPIPEEYWKFLELAHAQAALLTGVPVEGSKASVDRVSVDKDI